jgi:hypothetical protein
MTSRNGCAPCAVGRSFVAGGRVRRWRPKVLRCRRTDARKFLGDPAHHEVRSGNYAAAIRRWLDEVRPGQSISGSAEPTAGGCLGDPGRSAADAGATYPSRRDGRASRRRSRPRPGRTRPTRLALAAGPEPMIRRVRRCSGSRSTRGPLSGQEAEITPPGRS